MGWSIDKPHKLEFVQFYMELSMSLDTLVLTLRTL
jgi:hypothetical protein